MTKEQRTEDIKEEKAKEYAETTMGVKEKIDGVFHWEYDVRINAFKAGFEAGKQERESNWISVKDRLPESNTRVLIRTTREYVYDPEIIIGYVDQFGEEKSWYSSQMCEEEQINVTHWQPLPKPPVK